MPNSDEPKRMRPWRCINCGDRFASDRTDEGIHWTEYDPRDWEVRDAVGS